VPSLPLTRVEAPAYGLAALLTAAGIGHFVAPEPFAAIVPDGLGSPTGWVYTSGAIELLCAAGLVPHRTRAASAWVTAALFVAVFPANLTMALDADDRSVAYRALTYARLPLQLPLILWAVAVARRASSSSQPG
jgi:uncharacterized membrane protein